MQTLAQNSNRSSSSSVQDRSIIATKSRFFVKSRNPFYFRKPNLGNRSNKHFPKTVCMSIAPEQMVQSAPNSLVVQQDQTEGSMKAKFEKAIREAQNKICAAIEEADGQGKFQEDAWTREGGGGGITRVMQQGAVWEKAGVGVSVVYGSMPPEAYRAATETAKQNGNGDTGKVPFFAAGISSVMHPYNPHAPTMHFNYRYFETQEWNGIPGKWWFGGGTDITPSYVYEEDMKHFHGCYKAACDKHDPSYYPKFKKWCDDYFYIKHRGERRGLGGIFFDDLKDRDQDQIFAFSKECMDTIIESYVPLVQKHRDDPYTEQQKEWQQMRRGRYVEFNLVYDRGTTFGLKTGGRIESILMSLPLTARWEYNHQVTEDSPEGVLLACCRNPRDWV
eukprot:TRINITY_DN1367_c0_g4_i1.p1 TRINITY_DN1367_c0_g4~~TRINITY_DN1367_c0_g4_i1.p1  ORF type:complete len:412 (+),score=51.09 TRINITY_DN1367_c0_g4_i1:69-1238(+)